MTLPADGLVAALRVTNVCEGGAEDAARVAAAWLADHLDTLAETGYVLAMTGSGTAWYRDAAAAVRAAGGVE